MGLATPQALTYEQFKRLSAASDQRFELINGELHVAPAPSTRHQFVVQNLLYLLMRHVRAHGCGQVLHAPVDVVLGERERRSVVQPDLLFVSMERSSIIAESEVIGAPDFIAEVLSPSTADRDRRAKAALYARSGVPEYWIVNPDREEIELYGLGRGGYGQPVLLGLADRAPSRCIAGFEVMLTEVFALDSPR